MRNLRRQLFAILCVPAVAQAQDVLSLRVRQSIDFNPGFLPAQVECDNLAIVEFVDAGDQFRVTGLTPGRTQCGFTSIVVPSERRVITVEVEPYVEP